MNTLPSTILQNAHDFLQAHNWTRGLFGRTKAGVPLYSRYEVEDAARENSVDCCCAEGAIYAANPDALFTDITRAFCAMRTACGGDTIHGFNDVTAHDKRDVLRKFRVAIRQLKKEGN